MGRKPEEQVYKQKNTQKKEKKSRKKKKGFTSGELGTEEKSKVDQAGVIHREYNDPASPFALGGVDKMRRKFKNVSRNNMKSVLNSNIAYSLHKEARIFFKTRPIRASSKDEIWTMDLLDVSNVSVYNDNVTFLLIVVDIVSRFLWIEPLKRKTSKNIADAIAKIIVSSGRKPSKIFTDREFGSGEVLKVLKEFQIILYHTGSPLKASIAERMIRTLRKRLGRYSTVRNSRRYIDEIYSFADAHNKSLHSSIRMRPIDVTVKNQQFALDNLYGNIKKKELGYSSDFKVGQYVRIQHLKGLITKESFETWTREIFAVHKIHNKFLPVMFTLRDLNDEIIEGRFYKEELIPTTFNKDALYPIEKIIESEGKGKNERLKVRWVGYPSQFDSYINKADIVKTN